MAQVTRFEQDTRFEQRFRLTAPYSEDGKYSLLTSIHIEHDDGRNKAGVKVKAHDLNGRRAASTSILSFEIIRKRRITDLESKNGFDAFADQGFFNCLIDVLKVIEGDELFERKAAERM